MRKHLADSSSARCKVCAHSTAIIVGFLLILPGCCIPQLRCAQKGPATPQYYNWNNGTSFWGHLTGAENKQVEDVAEQATEPEDGLSGSDDTAARSDNPPSSVQLASLSSPTNTIALVETNISNEEPASASVDATIKNDSPVDALSDSSTDSIVVPKSVEAPEAPEAPAAANGVEVPSNMVVGPDGMGLGMHSLENSSQLPLEAFFTDAYLIGLIDQALAGNQELKILAEEIQIACNEAYALSGEYRPFVTYGAGAGLEKSSRFSRNGAVEDQLTAAPGKAFPDPLPDFLVATNVSWELDIWKKLRNAQCAAAMRYFGTREGRNYIVTRVVAEVAENYYELLALDNRLLTLDKTIEIQEQSLEVAMARKDAGRDSELPVQRFQAEVRKNQSEKLIIQQQIVEVENRINFLVGRYPQPVERISVELIDLNLNMLNAGVPSQLLRNRADIRQAERNVAAAGLDVKVARARFYPSFGLRAGVGLNAFNTKYLLSTPESLIYNVATDLVGPLINKRAIKADYRSANAAQLQAIYEYQRTVLTAHIEVVNYMTKVENYRQSIDVKKQQLDALVASVDVATKLYQNVQVEYVDVLLAQREMMEAKMILIETKQQQLSAIVNAYQALGGGGRSMPMNMN